MKPPKTLDSLVQPYFQKQDPYEIIADCLGPEVTAYREKWRLTETQRVLLPYPLHLNIELVPGCNLSCDFCFYSSSRPYQRHRPLSQDKISLERFKRLVDEAVAGGVCSLALNGNNEPLLQNDIDRYIRYARQAGVLDISLHTNGMLLDADLAARLLESGLTIIMFSVDAFSAEVYQQIRKGGDYETIIANVEHFLKLKKLNQNRLPLVRVSFVDNKVNHFQKQAFIDFWSRKVDYVLVQPFHNPRLGQPGYERVEKKFRLENTPFENCSQPWQRLFITSNGTVLPCCSYFGTGLPVGDINQNSLGQIWHNQKMQSIRQRVNVKSDYPRPCQRCRQSMLAKSDGD